MTRVVRSRRVAEVPEGAGGGRGGVGNGRSERTMVGESMVRKGERRKRDVVCRVFQWAYNGLNLKLDEIWGIMV